MKVVDGGSRLIRFPSFRLGLWEVTLRRLWTLPGRTPTLPARRARDIHEAFDDDWTHLRDLAVVRFLEKVDGGQDVPQGFVLDVKDVLLSNALLGQRGVCDQVLESHRRSLLTSPHRDQSWFDTEGQLGELAELEATVTADDFRDQIVRQVDSGRALLGFDVMTNPPKFMTEPAPELEPETAARRSARRRLWPSRNRQ